MKKSLQTLAVIGTFGICSLLHTMDSTEIGHVDLPDGKRIVMSTPSEFLQSTGVDVEIARLNPDGALDVTFGANGIRRLDIGNSISGSFTPITFSVNRRTNAITITGRGYPHVDPQKTVRVRIRLTSNGRWDDSFGVNGIEIRREE